MCRIRVFKLRVCSKSPPDSAPHNETVFDLRDLLRIIRIRLRLILGAALVVITLTGLILFQITPRYSATVLVLLDQRPNKIVDLNAILAGLPTDPASIENQVQILRSRNLMARVMDKLHLDRDGEFVPVVEAPASILNIFGGLKTPPWVEALESPPLASCYAVRTNKRGHRINRRAERRECT